MNKLIKYKLGMRGGIKGAGKPKKLIAAGKSRVSAKGNMAGGIVSGKSPAKGGSSRIVAGRVGKSSALKY